MGALTGKQIVECKNPLKIRRVDTPEWATAAGNDYVYVRMLRGDEAGEVQRLCKKAAENSEGEALAGWCVLGVCDKQGKRLFKAAHIKALVTGPWGPLQRCAHEVMKLNEITAGAEAKRKKP